MTRNRSERTESDLPPASAVKKLLAPLTDQLGELPKPSAPRHILPKNLPEAIRQLTDQELDRLLAAAMAEQRRRGREQPVSNQGSIEQAGERGPTPLKRGQVNAVRSAFKAGVKPSQIARQFGISPSEVRKALASDDVKR